MDGIGIDLVEIDRMEQLIEKELFVNRILTLNEQKELVARGGKKRRVEYLAGRYACKEAFSKAYGTGIGEVGFQDLEILTKESGAPYFNKSPYNGKVLVSLSHTDTFAVAQVYLEK